MIQSEGSFKIDKERRISHKNLNCNNKSQRLSHGHIKIPKIYTYHRFSKQVAIHLLSDISANIEENHLTDGCQQKFVPTYGACLAYQPLRSFSAFTSDTVRTSVISNRVEPITSLIPQHFYHPLLTHKYSLMLITSYNLVSRIPRLASYSKPVFIQIGRHSQFGAILCLILLDLTPYSTS